jgi:exonuclease VII small subunit
MEHVDADLRAQKLQSYEETLAELYTLLKRLRKRADIDTAMVRDDPTYKKAIEQIRDTIKLLEQEKEKLAEIIQKTHHS